MSRSKTHWLNHALQFQGWFCLGFGWFSALSLSHAQDVTPGQLEFFERKVRPVLVDRCYSCHSAESKKLKADLRLDSRDGFLKGGDSGKPSLIPGDPERSRLIEAIRYADQDLQMPPKGRLSPEAIADLTEWVKMGAPWPQETKAPAEAKKNSFDLEKRKRTHWAWRPIQRPPLPAVQDPTWPLQSPDRFLLARLESERLHPTPSTSKSTLLRRLHFDLVGLPPEPGEIAEFEQDSDPNAWANAVDRLLSSPRFGERWARHWLDLVRFAETLAHEFDYPRHNAWRYRDYVIRALNNDIPYDQFVREHIAGDLLPQPRRHPQDGSNESLIGTSFYWFGQQTHSPVDVQMHQAEFIDNQIDVLSKTFLGLTVACARCHDHKFDAISTRDFYSLYGVLSSSRYAQRSIDPKESTDPIVRKLIDTKPALRPLLADAWLKSSELLPAQLLERATNANIQQLRKQFPLNSSHVHPAPNAASTSPATRIIDFASGLPAGWSADGPAFEDATVIADDFILGATEQPVARLVTEPGLHSARWAPRLQGAVRSPTQVLTNRYLHVRCAGRDSRFNVVIANFTIIQAPIYGDLRRVLDFDEPRWVTIDLARWSGLRTYIEFCDLTSGDPGGGGRPSYGPNGWLSLHRIAWSDQPQPPAIDSTPVHTPPNEPLTDWTHRVHSAVAKALQLWRDPASATNQLDSQSLQLIDRLLAVGLLNPLPTADVNTSLSAARQLASRIPEPRLIPSMVEGTPLDEHVFIRGSPRTPGEPAPRRFLEALGGVERGPFHNGSGRLEFAEPLLDPSNPLPARVFVNRVWLHLFGRGIVPTPDDFGMLGQPPSHPELLDWLADWFRTEGNWSVKKLIRLLATSRGYAMASINPDPNTHAKDPDNVLLHRAHVKRLEGEIIRDSILKLSGRLDPKMYGPSIPTHLTDFMDGRGRPGTSGPRDGAGRRSIYQEVRNNFLSPMMRTFDMPVPFTTVGRRTLSNVPAQSLILMNDPFVQDQARLWAERLLASPQDPGSTARIQNLYESAFGRRATETELSAAHAFLISQGGSLGIPSNQITQDPKVWADLCHVLLNIKEFIYLN